MVLILSAFKRTAAAQYAHLFKPELKQLPVLALATLMFLSTSQATRAENPAQQFCRQFIGWSNEERLDWTKNLDLNTTYPTLKANKDLPWSEAQYTTALECLNETRALYTQKVLQACQDGMDSFAPFQNITAERLKACINKVMTGKLDSEWATGPEAALSKKAFCPDWNSWGPDQRDEFMQKSERSALKVLDRHDLTRAQRETVLGCIRTSSAKLSKRLDNACKGAVSYQDAVNMVAMQFKICIRQAGLE